MFCGMKLLALFLLVATPLFAAEQSLSIPPIGGRPFPKWARRAGKFFRKKPNRRK